MNNQAHSTVIIQDEIRSQKVAYVPIPNRAAASLSTSDKVKTP